MIFGFGKKKIKWEWLLQNACSLLDGDDKQFDYILETLTSRFQDKIIDIKKDSSEYLYSKYKYRVISTSYIVSVLIIKYKDLEIDENQFQEWKQKLQLLAIAGNPNPIFSIDGKSIDGIELSKIDKLIEADGGKEQMESFHETSIKLIITHLNSVSDEGAGVFPEIGKNLYALYADCFSSFIKGELDEDESETLIMYISGQCRGQTNAAISLINS